MRRVVVTVVVNLPEEDASHLAVLFRYRARRRRIAPRGRGAV